MCGIAGILGPDRPGRRERLRAMVAAMRARGPDHGGYFSAPGLSMGMRRLAILDVAGGDQPLQDESGRITVVCNGEIYSYVELRRELEALGARFRTGSDVEVLAHGYARWGLENLLARLDGMFAFAIHDARSDEVHLARDGVGIKPLLYTQRGEHFAFASSMSALLASELVELLPDADALRSYLYLQFVPGDATVLRDVRRLLPGHSLTIRQGRVERPRPFWRFPTMPDEGAASGSTSTSSRSASFEESVSRTREVFARSIERHLRSDVELAVFLSGGFDSSLVLGEVSRQRSSPIRAYSIAMDAEGAWDESEHARAAAERFGADLEILRFGPKEIAELLPRIGVAMDEPLGDAAALPTLLLSRFAARDVKVVLTGEGADELFAGYDYYASFAGRGALRPGLGERLRERARALARKIATPRAALPWHAGCSANSGFPYALHETRIEALLREVPSADGVCPRARARTREEAVVASAPNRDALASALRVDASAWLPDDLLVKLDRCTMAHSLEGRVPFLDRELVELASTMPSAHKHDGTTGKRVLRAAFAELLGPLAKRRKHGFDLPMGDWIRGGLRPAFEARLGRADGLAPCPWLDARAVRALLDAHMRGAASLERGLWSIYALVASFEAWGRAQRRTQAPDEGREVGGA